MGAEVGYCDRVRKEDAVAKKKLLDAVVERFDGNAEAASNAVESLVETITREVARATRSSSKGWALSRRP